MLVLQWEAEARGGVQPAPSQGRRHERRRRRQSDDLSAVVGRSIETKVGGGQRWGSHLCLIFFICPSKRVWQPPGGLSLHRCCFWTLYLGRCPLREDTSVTRIRGNLARTKQQSRPPDVPRAMHATIAMPNWRDRTLMWHMWVTFRQSTSKHLWSLSHTHTRKYGVYQFISYTSYD